MKQKWGVSYLAFLECRVAAKLVGKQQAEVTVFHCEINP